MMARMLGGAPTVFVTKEQGDGALIPLIIKRIPLVTDSLEPPQYDARTIPGYPPILGLETRSATAKSHRLRFSRIISQLTDQLNRIDVVTLDLQFAPQHGLDAKVFSGIGEFKVDGTGVSLHLDRSECDAWVDLRENHRRDISCAIAMKYFVRVSDGWDGYHLMLNSYGGSTVKAASKACNMGGREYVLELRKQLAGHLFCFVVEVAGKVVCAALVSEVCGTVRYHFGATHRMHGSLQPLILLVHEVRKWAKQRGNDVFLLGGDLKERDGISWDMKTGFSPHRQELCSMKIVCNPTRYEALSQQALREGRPLQRDAFPLYRPTR
jgi:hypothetical protein